MELIQKASKLGYKHYTELSIEELDSLPLKDLSKQVEYFFIQKWLREKHNWNIIVFNDDGDIEESNLRYNYELRYTLPSFKVESRDSLIGKYDFKIYEEALEKALQEALKLI